MIKFIGGAFFGLVVGVFVGVNLTTYLIFWQSGSK